MNTFQSKNEEFKEEKIILAANDKTLLYTNQKLQTLGYH